MSTRGYNRKPCPKHPEGGGSGWTIKPSAGTCAWQPDYPNGSPCGEPYTEDDWVPVAEPTKPTATPASGKTRKTRPVVVDGKIEIDMPGAFDSFFSMGSVGQGLLDQAGYEGAPGLYAAYDGSRKINRGKGYSLRLTIPADDMLEDVLYCLWHYAVTCAEVNKDNAHEDPEARTEMYAGRTMAQRVETVARAAGLKMAGWV